MLNEVDALAGVDEVPKLFENSPKAVAVVESNGELAGAPNGEDPGFANALLNGEVAGVAALPPNGEADGIPCPNPDCLLPDPKAVVKLVLPPNGEVVIDGPPSDVDGVAIPPKEVVDGAPNGLVAVVAGVPNPDAVDAVPPPNGFDEAALVKLEPLVVPSDDGAPNVVERPPLNEFVALVVLVPPKGLLVEVVPPLNGFAVPKEDAVGVAAGNGLAAPPCMNGFVMLLCVPRPDAPSTASPANSLWADW